MTAAADFNAQTHDRPGLVHVTYPPNPRSYDTMARKWAKDNGWKVETRVFGDVVLLRWSR